MKKLIIGTFLLVIHVNLCIGQQLSHSLFNFPPHIEQAAASASIITNNFPRVTAVSSVTEQTGEELLRAQVLLGNALFRKNTSDANSAAQALLSALQNNERARREAKIFEPIDITALVELILSVNKNKGYFPGGVPALLGKISGNDLMLVHFPLLIVLAHENSMYYDQTIAALVTETDTAFTQFEGLFNQIKQSSGPTTQERIKEVVAADKEIQKSLTKILDALKASPLGSEEKDFFTKSLILLYQKFQEKMNQDLKDQSNGEPAAKRQRTTEDS